MRLNGVLLLSIVSSLLFIFTGCFQGEQTFEEIDVPEEITLLEEDELAEDEALTEDQEGNEIEREKLVSETDETVLREIFLFDADGLVAPQTIEIPKTESIAKTTLQYMISDGPVTEVIPNGFQAVLPANTEVLGLNLNDEGTLIIDFSEEFTNYHPEDEQKILEALTHTLTQFDNIERIKIRINGEDQDEMPIKGTPISAGYSREHGINIVIEERPSLLSSQVETVYYPKEYNENTYYVPITKYFNVENSDLFSEIVYSIINGPSPQFQTLHVFNDGIELEHIPTLKDGVLSLIFNKAILKEETDGVISDHVMESIVKAMTSIDEVEAVHVQVSNIRSITNEAGNRYDHPVTVNDFQSEEKM